MSEFTSPFALDVLARAGLPAGRAELRGRYPGLAEAARNLSGAEKRLTEALRAVIARANSALGDLDRGHPINVIGALQGDGPAADARAAEVATWQRILETAIEATPEWRVRDGIIASTRGVAPAAVTVEVTDGRTLTGVAAEGTDREILLIKLDGGRGTIALAWVRVVAVQVGGPRASTPEPSQ